MVFLVSVSNCVFSRSRTICFTRRVVCKKKWIYVLAFFNIFSRSLICLHWGCALAELSVSIKSTLLIVIYSFLVSAAAYKQIFVHVNKSLCMSTSALYMKKLHWLTAYLAKSAPIHLRLHDLSVKILFFLFVIFLIHLIWLLILRRWIWSKCFNSF